MWTVFISHSRHDRDLVRTFQDLFMATRLQPVLMEFEAYRLPPWLDIRERVREASAVFLLLGPGLRGSPYTQNWVAWELGLAAAMEKETWVYEQLNQVVDFPVPYCTDYVLYDRTAPQDLAYIQQLIQRYDPGPQLAAGILWALLGGALAAGPGAAVAGLLGLLAGRSQQSGIGPFPCPVDTCGITFRVHTPVAYFPCPSCRQTLRLRGSEGPMEGEHHGAL